MKCPECSKPAEVVETRHRGNYVRRRYKCFNEHRFSTIEQVHQFHPGGGPQAPENRLLPDLSAAPAVPAKCDGGTCGLGGYCTNCPRQSAAPAVREPVTASHQLPLTDEQIMSVQPYPHTKMVDFGIYEVSDDDCINFARAIEQAHGIGRAAE